VERRRAKRAVIDFVNRVTKDGGPDFVTVRERIATFDNDGTLWSEQPIYNQFAFALDRVKALAPQHPSGRHNSRSKPCSTATSKRSPHRARRV
jgi:hypothetical protein